MRAALLLLLAGCGAPAISPDGFQTLSMAPVARDGHSAAVSFAVAPAARTILLRATFPGGSAGRCVTLDRADLDGNTWIADGGRPDWGNYCTTCTERASVGHGWGLFSLPNDGGPMPPGGTLTVGLDLRDCTTLLPVDPLSAPPAVRLELWQPRTLAPEHGTLPVRFFFEDGGQFGSDDPLFGDAVGVMRDLYAGVGIDLDAAPGGDFVRTDPDPLTFGTDDHTALDAQMVRAVAQLGGFVPVIFTRCLVQHDPLQRRDDRLDGISAGVPGGFAPDGLADAVYVRFGACDALEPVAYWPSAQMLGKVIAHEVGHFLGLYHSVEASGVTDLLDDTDATNLMYYHPLDAAVTGGFSPEQGRVMRMHPLVAP